MKKIFFVIFSLFTLLSANKISCGYTWEYFDRYYKNGWKEFYTEYKTNPQNPLIFRINQAERFGLLGRQLEIDWYPQEKNHYWHLNAGFSGTELYPDSRYGIEFFQKIEPNSEISFGIKELNFPSKHVHIYTTSIGKYWENWWTTVRTYSTKNSGYYELLFRRYFADVNNYFSIFSGTGIAIDENFLLDSYHLTRKKRLGVDYQFGFGSWSIKISRIGESFEDITKKYINRISTSLVVSFNF